MLIPTRTGVTTFLPSFRSENESEYASLAMLGFGRENIFRPSHQLDIEV
jgi:hypothetical protein